MATLAAGTCGLDAARSQSVRHHDVQYSWRNVTVGGGGYAPNIVFSSAEKDLAYLRTDMGGAYRWDARSRRWIPLQDSNSVSSFMGIESIAPDPVNPNVVYMAAGMNASAPAAIMRSTDRGRTWHVVPVPFAMGGNEPGRGLGERLAVDPNEPKRILFGSRHDGLWQSRDAGRTWQRVPGFPHRGMGRPSPKATHGGVSFVAFDPTSARPGKPSQRLWAGIADPGVPSLYRSDDGGATWSAVATPALFAAKGAIDTRGVLWVGFSSGIGPSDAETGAVWRYDTDGQGRDVTPLSWRASGGQGGFLGVAVARTTPGTAAVTTINRHRAGDSLWLSSDDGATWSDVGARSSRDVSATPFLLHEGKGADFGHWISGLAIDPFDARHVAYTTGATLYATRAITSAGPVAWRPWVKGIEQTAIITLISPPRGAPLISGFGDLAGFVHDGLDQSPVPTFVNPYLSNTNTLDYAGLSPNIIVRSGSLYADRPRDASLARSIDGGRSWIPLRVPPLGKPAFRDDLIGEAAITVNADGTAIVVATKTPQVTRDGGLTWQAIHGLPGRTRAVADKVYPEVFYAVDPERNALLVSRDSALSFDRLPGRGLPVDLSASKPRNRESQSALLAAPDRAGVLWLQVGDNLFHSVDGGTSFSRSNGRLAVELFGLGKGAVFAIGTLGRTRGIWRSYDTGRSWVRIDDDAHRWGGRYRVISGDPRRRGRVYVGTDGRGIFFGDPR
jgi:hypothetical protein